MGLNQSCFFCYKERIHGWTQAVCTKERLRDKKVLWQNNDLTKILTFRVGFLSNPVGVFDYVPI